MHTGLRDRVLLATLAYTFARIGSVVNLKVEDYYPSGKRFLLSSLVVLEFGVRPVRLKQAGGDRRVNTFKEFEKDQANGVALWTEPIAARFGKFFDQALGSQFA